MDTPRRSTWQDNRARRSAKTRRLSPPHPRWAADPPCADPPEDETPPSGWRSIWQGLATGALVVFGLGLLALAVGIGLYAYYARTLPSPEELYERAATFQSARIYDRHGRLLFEFFDPQGGRRTVAAYEEIPDVVVQATVATEDASFFTKPGVSPLSTLRALWQDLRAGEAVAVAIAVHPRQSRREGEEHHHPVGAHHQRADAVDEQVGEDRRERGLQEDLPEHGGGEAQSALLPAPLQPRPERHDREENHEDERQVNRLPRTDLYKRRVHRASPPAQA